MISSMAGDLLFLGLVYIHLLKPLNCLTTSLYKELKSVDSNVKVIIIEPGLYRTGFNEVMMDNKYDDEDSMFKEYRKRYMIMNNLKSLLSSNNLKSIVDQIVKAVEDENSRFKYKAPFIHQVLKSLCYS